MAEQFRTYRHVRNKTNNNCGITFCFDIDHFTQTMRFAFAVCSSKDNFCRSVGRNYAEDRLDRGFAIQAGYDKDISLVQNAINACKNVLNANIPRDSNTSPTRTKLLYETERMLDEFHRIKSLNFFDDIESMAKEQEDITDYL